MRILLDECLPAEFADELKGHHVSTVQQEGWSGLENGALLEQASTRFSVFITVDKHIQSTGELPGQLAVITLRARANRIEALRPLVPQVLDLLRMIRPGTFETVWFMTTECSERSPSWQAVDVRPAATRAAVPRLV
jgi:predicted nuclease of predicted toxin-antitoxin system